MAHVTQVQVALPMMGLVERHILAQVALAIQVQAVPSILAQVALLIVDPVAQGIPGRAALHTMVRVEPHTVGQEVHAIPGQEVHAIPGQEVRARIARASAGRQSKHLKTNQPVGMGFCAKLKTKP